LAARANYAEFQVVYLPEDKQHVNITKKGEVAQVVIDQVKLDSLIGSGKKLHFFLKGRYRVSSTRSVTNLP
jgi:lipopolysaccharide export system protein LptA